MDLTTYSNGTNNCVHLILHLDFDTHYEDTKLRYKVRMKEECKFCLPPEFVCIHTHTYYSDSDLFGNRLAILLCLSLAISSQTDFSLLSNKHNIIIRMEQPYYLLKWNK